MWGQHWHMGLWGASKLQGQSGKDKPCVGGRGLSSTNPLVCPTWVSFHPARVFTHGTTKALVMNCDFSHSSPQAIHQGERTSYRPLDLTPWPPPRRKEPWGKGPRAGEMLGLLGKMKQCLFFQAHKRLTHGCLTIPPGVMTQAQVLETRVWWMSRRSEPGLLWSIPRTTRRLEWNWAYFLCSDEDFIFAGPGGGRKAWLIFLMAALLRLSLAIPSLRVLTFFIGWRRQSLVP